MKPEYLISLISRIDGQVTLVRVRTIEEVSTFLAHVDTDAYVVGDITATSEIHTDYKQFCKQDTKLEHGGEN